MSYTTERWTVEDGIIQQFNSVRVFWPERIFMNDSLADVQMLDNEFQKKKKNREN